MGAADTLPSIRNSGISLGTPIVVDPNIIAPQHGADKSDCFRLDVGGSPENVLGSLTKLSGPILPEVDTDLLFAILNEGAKGHRRGNAAAAADMGRGGSVGSHQRSYGIRLAPSIFGEIFSKEYVLKPGETIKPARQHTTYKGVTEIRFGRSRDLEFELVRHPHNNLTQIDEVEVRPSLLGNHETIEIRFINGCSVRINTVLDRRTIRSIEVIVDDEQIGQSEFAIKSQGRGNYTISDTSAGVINLNVKTTKDLRRFLMHVIHMASMGVLPRGVKTGAGASLAYFVIKHDVDYLPDRGDTPVQVDLKDVAGTNYIINVQEERTVPRLVLGSSSLSVFRDASLMVIGGTGKKEASFDLLHLPHIIDFDDTIILFRNGIMIEVERPLLGNLVGNVRIMSGDTEVSFRASFHDVAVKDPASGEIAPLVGPLLQKAVKAAMAGKIYTGDGRK